MKPVKNSIHTARPWRVKSSHYLSPDNRLSGDYQKDWGTEMRVIFKMFISFQVPIFILLFQNAFRLSDSDYLELDVFLKKKKSYF